MNIKEKSARIKTLMNDDTFKDVISEVMERQVLVFMNAHSTTEERDDAHGESLSVRVRELIHDLRACATACGVRRPSYIRSLTQT